MHGSSKKPLTRVSESKPVPVVHGKRGLERGWHKRLAKRWRRVGGFPGTLQFCNSKVFLGFLVFIKENLKINKDFLSLPNPQNPWKRQRKHRITKEIPRFKFTKEIQKNQGKEGLGGARLEDRVCDSTVNAPILPSNLCGFCAFSSPLL